MSRALRSAALHARSARRLLGRGGISLLAAREAPDDRLVFVVGSPRSGTTFLAGAIGSCPGFVDLGEVAALKAAIPRLTTLGPADAAEEIASILRLTRRLGLVGGLRAVEQTPETTFVLDAVRIAFPAAAVVHIVRDGRDVVASLLERGWLSEGRTGADDAGHGYGAAARFWVEPERRADFEAATDARRAAWAWRRYAGTAHALGAIEVRYERLARDPAGVADELAAALDVAPEPLRAALSAVRGGSIGRYRRDLAHAEIADVEAEAGDLLRELGYL